LRAAGLDPGGGLSAEDLGALDHFHTGGRRATVELLQWAPIEEGQRVLDVGAGLGGPARLVASARGCRVVCLERSADYCAGAKLLNKLTGLDQRVEVHQGSALDMPFPEASFDVVWMQNVGMGIADKRRLYRDVHRVLKPGGMFVFQEVAAGDAGAPHFPLPWATDPADSHLVPVTGFRQELEDCGFTKQAFEDTSEAELSRPSAGAAAGPLTLAVYVDNIAEKSKDSRRSLQEGRIRLVRGIFRVR
jgi:sarcosine/dimethylglycine N-methyltransferase